MSAKNSRGRSMLDMVLGKLDRQTEPSTSTEFNSNQKDESFSLLCDETFPSSLMDISLTDLAFGIEEPFYKRPQDNNLYHETPTTDSSDAVNIESEKYIEQVTTQEKIEEPQDNNLNHETPTTESSHVENIETENYTEQVTPQEWTEELQNNNLNYETPTTESSHVVNIETENNTEQVTTQEKTKSGKPRMRRKFEEKLKTRLKDKKKKKLDKMAVKPGCNETCTKKCMSSFTELERIRINETFWNFNYEAQGLYVKSLVIEKEVQRRFKDSQMMRKHTYMYFFEKENKKKEVCKIFFLTTLGYHKNNDRRVLDILKKLPEAQGDRRGKHDNSKQLDRATIKQHIESFKPAIAHYRRAHAPNRRYLPSDLNTTMMHADFMEKNPNFKVSYDLYRKFLKKDMNISFAQLGNEECEQCETFKLHQISCKDTEHCTDCTTYQSHREKFEKARSYYQQDVIQSTNSLESSKCYFSADLQKVIMLPRLDMFKVVMFCPRLIAFNETFVPLGSTSKEKPFAAVWHEAVCGRKQEDIISTYRSFFENKRDCDEIIVWTDNCTSQNKNWAFFTFLVQIINSQIIRATKITIKYFEPGHTFMSADNFHHQVENQLQKAKKVYDFSDFIDCVQLANSGKVNVKPMEISDFYKYKDHSSQYKLKKCEERTYLKDIVCVEVHRNSMKLFARTSHDDNNMIEIDFLKNKVIKNNAIPEPERNQTARGITQERKTGILRKLGNIIPPNRLLFWENLPVNDESVDLTVTREPQE